MGKKRPVVAIDDDGKVVTYYDSIAAAVWEGGSAECIRDCCNGRAKTHRGFRWRYATPEDKERA